MYVVEVIPVSRGVHTHSLSYYSSEIHERGSFLVVPVRSKQVLAIVLNTREATTVKTALRAATFSLKKLPSQQTEDRLSDVLLETVDRLAEYHATTAGAVLYSLFPKEVRDGKISVPAYPSGLAPYIAKEERPPEVFQDTKQNRFVEYSRLVRESFAGKQSILLVLPSIEQCREAYSRLSSGIEEFTVVLHGKSGTRSLTKSYNLLTEGTHPLLIIATPAYAFIDRIDIQTVILENERSSGYTGKTRPYLDYRFALLTHNSLHKRHIIIADTLPRSENEYYLRNEFFAPRSEQPKRLELQGQLQEISLKPDPDGKSAFTLFSDKLTKKIEETLASKGRVFLFAARRGLAPVVACVDCGHIFRDPESGAPLVLHRRVRNNLEERWLVSSVSGHREQAPDICPSCGGWRLRERGIGIQHVFDECKSIFGEDKIILFDHTTASTPAKARKLRDQFYTKKGVVLLGTSLALPYLQKPVHTSAIVSLDSLKAIPSWRQLEESVNILLTLRELTKDVVYVQTRTDDPDLVGYARNGTVQQFYDAELTDRKTFSYPPYSVFIHLSWQGNTEATEKMAGHIETLFKPYNVMVYGMPHEGGGMILKQALMRMPSSKWPEENLRKALRSLPPGVRIVINPDKIV